MEEVLLLKKFFSIVDTCLSSENTARQICANGQNGDFLRPVFAANRMPHISDMHSKFALRPHHVWKYVDIQSPTAEIRQGEKIERKIVTTGQKYKIR